MSKNHAQYFLMFNLSPSNPKLICHPGFCSAGIPRLLIFLNVRPFKNQTNAIIVTIHLLTLVPHKSSYHVRQKPQFQCETHPYHHSLRIIRRRSERPRSPVPRSSRRSSAHQLAHKEPNQKYSTEIKIQS